jgi:hypothetical protein
MNIKRIEYGGWPNCYRVSTDHMELIITSDVGPRIIDCRLPGGENLLYQFPEQMGNTFGEAFRFYGGHRLWHAPEDPERTYQPDNQPLSVDVRETQLQLTAPLEHETGIQKHLYITPHETHITLDHSLTNHNLWDVTLAPWALTMMTGGGTAILPLPPRGSHEDNLQPTSRLALWAYTDLSDPRWQYGRQYLRLRQDSQHTTPQKIGAYPVQWLAYVLDDVLFLKEFSAETATYPDNQSNAELFTDEKLLELESLGVLAAVAPGDKIHHREIWSLHRLDAPLNTDDDISEFVLPRLTQTPR